MSLLVLARVLAMFSRKDKSIMLAGGGNTNTQDAGPSHPATGVYGLKKCHDPPEAIAECVLPHSAYHQISASRAPAFQVDVLMILLATPASSSSTA